MTTVVDLAADHLAAQVPSRTVYRHALPERTDARYLWVYGNAPVMESDDLCDSLNLRQVTLWVTSASRAADPQAAAQEAAWGAEKAQEALRGWRPGAGYWKPVPLSSQPPQRDTDLPDAVVVYAVATWGFQYQP